MKMIDKILIKLFILQIVSNEQRRKDGLKYLGKGCFNAYRLNPYNPLSYIVFVIYTIIGILMFGFVGILDRFENPFKWN